MKNFKIYLYIAAASASLAACKPSINTLVPARGSADFTRYIALGNSLTAGFADGGLYRAGQLNSFPSIIAAQMQTVGGGTFNQPLFTADQANGTGYLKLTGFDASGNPVTTQVSDKTAYRGAVVLPGIGAVNLLTKYTDGIENFGVPGIKLRDITNPAYGNYNNYYERLLPNASPGNTTAYIDFATAKSYTFFSNWLGNNDALSYATSGGAIDPLGSNVLTDKSAFNSQYIALIAKLTAGGQKGVVATIPDVTTVPLFTTVTVGAVLAAVQKANPTVAALYISAKANSDVTSTAHSPRPATANDLLLLTVPTSKIGTTTATNPYPYGLHPLNPIEDQFVLDATEVALVRDYVSSYNQTIKAVAASKGLAVFDAFTFLTNLKTSGLVVNGVSLTSNFISGGVFSLDGVHLTPRGYAIVANEFIKAINSQYGSTIPVANVANYNGVLFP